MTVEQFDPSTSNSVASQTTTLDIPSKMIEAQHQEVINSHPESKRAAKIGFISLGCPSTSNPTLLAA
jgi:ribosomal protein S12 methylthiotransferase